MNLKPSHHSAIRKLLREQPERVRLGKVWQELQRQFECGQVRGDYLYFSASEREALRRQCRRLWGFDPIEERIAGDRQHAAALGAIDEKIAPQRPDDGFVLPSTRARPANPPPECHAALASRVSGTTTVTNASVRTLALDNERCRSSFT